MIKLLSTFCAVLTLSFLGNICCEGRSHNDGSIGREPQVVFSCGRPARHMTTEGWKDDVTTGCLAEPTDILDYCRRVYPTLDVRNIVESPRSVEIKNWCPTGRTRCHRHTITVRPFRCLVGPFQSDALLVPRNCLFDHMHDPRTCQSFDSWNKSSLAACKGRGLVQHSFSIIQPCSVDRFSGAEFVCCPETEISKPHSTPVPTTVVTETTTTASNLINKIRTDYDDDENDDDQDITGDDNDAYLKYMQNGYRTGNKSEHAQYVKAKSDLERRYHDKVAKMMKEWSATHQRVQEMKIMDAMGADKLNRQITARFQKMYDSMEKEQEQELRQLNAVHHQRIQSEMNERKKKAMQAYMNTLTSPTPSSSKILHALKLYLKLEQKDRLHTIMRYQKVEQSDPVQAESMFSYVADHLKVIDQRIAQALDMLGRVPSREKKIRERIEDFLNNYHSLDESLAVIVAKMAETNTGKTSATRRPTPAASASHIAIGLTKATRRYTPAWTTNHPATSQIPTKTTTEQGPPTIRWERVSTPAVIDHFDDGVMESRQDYVQVKQVGSPHHVGNSQFNEPQVLELRKSSLKSDSGMYLATPLGIALCSLALVIIIAIGIATLRRRMTTPSGQGSPEEDCPQPTLVAPPLPPKSRQTKMNGYENPTHKFLDNDQVIA